MLYKYIKNFKLTLVILLFIIISLNVYAFGISSYPWPDNTIDMYPGEVKDIVLELQNLVGEEDLTFEGKVAVGSEIAEITDKSNIYPVPFGARVDSHVRLKVPENATKKNNWTVEVSYVTVAPPGGGVLFRQGVTKQLKIKATGVKPSIEGRAIFNLTKGNLIVLIALIVVIIIAILLILFLKRKKKGGRR